MEVSLEFYLVFPDICMRKLIWVDRADEETTSSPCVMKNFKFFFWIWVLELFWQHYTHPLSCWVLCCLQWQHRCWDQTAWWVSGNVSTEQWYSFTQDFKHREVPDWTKQTPSRLPALGPDFHRAALQTASAGEFRFRHTPNSGAMSPCAQVLTAALSQCVVFPAISPPPYTGTTGFLFVQISSPPCGLRKNQIHLHRYYTYFRKPVACIQMHSNVIFICL